jgi:hypothetical protein
MMIFVSCADGQTSDEQTPKSNTHPSFAFSVESFETEVKVGETVKVRAHLNNVSANEMTISHLPLLIWLRVKKEGGELEGSTMSSMAVRTVIEAGESVEKDANFKFTEEGTYYLYAQTFFRVLEDSGELSEEFSYHKVIKITVTE